MIRGQAGKIAFAFVNDNTLKKQVKAVTLAILFTRFDYKLVEIRLFVLVIQVVAFRIGFGQIVGKRASHSHKRLFARLERERIVEKVRATRLIVNEYFEALERRSV